VTRRTVLLGAALAIAAGCGEWEAGPGSIEGAPRSREAIAAAAAAQRDAAARLRLGATPPTTDEKLVLFGDLHVHTSFSWDGFLLSLPLAGGEGAHPSADACDFARHCAGLDFFALTDHAESLSREQWELEKESVRQCNALAGDPRDPDIVVFAGFEWSQAGLTPDTHWGHRCVIFPGTDDAELPLRPIASEVQGERYARLRASFATLRWIQPWHFRAYDAFVDYLDSLIELRPCAGGAPTADCIDLAETPGDLYAKLDAGGFEALVIPHGTAWGTYTPAGASIDRHLDPGHYDPRRQPLIEIFSGHGNSEEYRSWREREFGPDGEPTCPEPSPGYLPCCWQAGEIMRRRCGDLPDAECEARVEQARRFGARAWTRPQQIFPDASPEDWLDCDQCRDCFKPDFALRPRESVQYAMALSHEDARDSEGRPLRFRYGFVASSDGHSARPGTGYKQVERAAMTDGGGEVGPLARRLLSFGRRMEEPRRPVAPRLEGAGIAGTDLRVTSFLYPGGLAAVHASGRDRVAIWDALHRRETYATSGPRILLWFDLLPPSGGRLPMGSEVTLRGPPRFEVRAVGSFVQEPGCPESARAGLSPERQERLCRGECHNPGRERHPIAAIEVVRILPRSAAGEPVGAIVEDPWRVYECLPEPGGCVVRFEDAESAAYDRDALYYVRALQEPTPAINGANLRTSFDEAGDAVAIRPCAGGDDCLAPVQERAWSSPIFVNRPLGPTERLTRARPGP
jgi:hypothetical protein